LIAAWDYRIGSNGDLPNVIDVICKRSTDGGLTWGSQITISAHTGGSTATTANGSGDVCLVTDPSTGRIFAHYLYSPANVGFAQSDNTTSTSSTTTVHPCYRYSDDDGVTWSAQVDIIGSVKTSSMYGIFAASGHGWAANDGSLLAIPFSYITSMGGSTSVIFIAYSTDHGATWQRGSTTGTNNPGENHVVKLSDGTYLISARPGSGGSRLFFTSSTLTGTWTGTIRTDLPDPSCNNDLIRVDPNDTSIRKDWLLTSGVSSTASRTNLTVWLSKDNGATWPYAWQVYNVGDAAYSTLVRIAPDSYGIFWEDTTQGIMQFTRFDLSVFKGA